MNQEQDNQENEDNEGEVLQKEYEFVPTKGCQFKQRGPYVVCVSCELQHAFYIGMNKIMVGEKEDGTPILENRAT